MVRRRAGMLPQEHLRRWHSANYQNDTFGTSPDPSGSEEF